MSRALRRVIAPIVKEAVQEARHQISEEAKREAAERVKQLADRLRRESAQNPPPQE